MSLVAYDSSDDSSENEENDIATTTTKTVNNETNKRTVQINSKLSLPAPKVISQNTKDDEEEENDDTGDFEQFLHTLPKPKDSHSENTEEDDDIPLKKETESQVIKQARKQTVKITVPSLSEFKDLEEESEVKPTRTVQPSEKGCGLFAFLAPPKKEIIKSKILIPHAIKNATVRPNIQLSKTIQKSNMNQPNDSKIRSAVNKSYNELSSDDEDEEEVDFFGLTSSKNAPDSSILPDSELPLSDLANRSSTEETSLIKHMEDHTIQTSSSTSTNTSINRLSSDTSKTLISNIMNLPKEEILLKNKAEVGPKLPVPEQEYNIDTEGNVAFDEKAIEYLCGKRGVKRKNKEIDEANIIEINGEDIKPDEREWLVKALTEESVHRPVSMQSCGINSQSKKKHQITYLAHQAKAMELELKNQWSQNRMARKQAKSKYGF